MLRTSTLLMTQPKASHATDFSPHSLMTKKLSADFRRGGGRGTGDGMGWEGETPAEPKNGSEWRIASWRMVSSFEGQCSCTKHCTQHIALIFSERTYCSSSRSSPMARDAFSKTKSSGCRKSRHFTFATSKVSNRTMRSSGIPEL